VPRRGYRFVAQVTEVCDDEAESVLAAEVTRAHVLIEESLPAAPDDGARHELRQPDQSISTVGAARVRRKTTLRWPVRATACVLVAACAVGGYLFIRARGTRAGAGATPLKSIAVLPFRPDAAGERDETLELGMADTLITRLSSLPQLTVRPVSAVRKYTDLQQDALAAGQELGVDSVLDGSVQRAGDELRVTVRLVKVADGTTPPSPTPGSDTIGTARRRKRNTRKPSNSTPTI
jgi:TolB-like protein